MIKDSLREAIKLMEKDEKNSHGYRAHSSFLMLEHVDLMIDRYIEEKQIGRGAILLDVFGLLQGFFVAIDALYDLSIGLTKYKYPININQNETLHELKYIRNDIVGHPTHRLYPNGGMGFSILDTNDLSKEKLSYKTYIYEKNELKIETKEVYFNRLIDQYRVEKKKVLNDIAMNLHHSISKTDIPENVAILYETMNLEELTKIVDEFKSAYQLDDSSSHRFLWRAELTKKLILWKESDEELSEVVLYMTKLQVSKLYEIALDMERRTQNALYTPIPKLLHSFYKFVRKHEKIIYPLLANLNDSGHPLHRSDIAAIQSMNPSKEAAKLIGFLMVQTDSDRRFLIGSILRSYRLKHE